MPILTALIGLALVAQIPTAEDPVLRKDRDLNCAEWARTANLYLRLGEEKAVAELLDRSGPKPTLFAIRPNHACHILRLLFEPKKGETLRRPLLGGWEGPPQDTNWPDFPFVAHGGTIFMFTEDYVLAGEAETPTAYAEYLRKNGLFRTQMYAVPSGREANRALELLVRSRRWQAELGASVLIVGRLRRQTDYWP